MPELPEVETVARSLRERAVGRTLGGSWTSGKKLRRPIDDERLRAATEGARLDAVERRGKYLVLRLSRGDAIVCHLGMSGRLLVEKARTPRAPHTHVELALEPGAEVLRFIDPRRFGFFSTMAAGDLDGSAELELLGVDPLTPAFTPAHFAAALATSGRAIKDFLLDQRHVAGIGNIYAAEALFVAGISPRRAARTLGPRRAARLHAAIIEVLAASVERRGTSISDYVDAAGRAGDNQNHLHVYGRAGAPCLRCQTPVRRLVQGARSTFFCPRCQR